MSDPTTLPPAGWFPDPSGAGRQRYWDGTAWTGHTAPTRPADASAASSAAIRQPPLPDGARVNTVWAWLLAFLPLASLLSLPLIDYGAFFRESLNSARDPTATLRQFSNPGLLLTQLIGFLSIAANVLIAALDHRSLRGLGVVRPFHWAWSFLQPTYMIGRAVVLRRRVHRGAAPTAVYFAVSLVVFIVTFTAVGIALGAAFANFDPSSFSTDPGFDPSTFDPAGLGSET